MESQLESEAAPIRIREELKRVRDRLNQQLRGKEQVVDRLLVGVCAGGSVLIEDVPGVGKTTLSKALASALGLKFQRVQCTPDLLPADILGCSVFHPHEGTFSFRPGPIFSQLLLIDEINRASPRTQSALLEAMAEHQVTVDGVRHELLRPFIVIATQNPHGFHGTSPLPESQLDRFLLHLSMDYPEHEDELQMLLDRVGVAPIDGEEPIMSVKSLVIIQHLVEQVGVERSVAEYMLELVRRTREDPRLTLGCSPRGSISVLRAAQSTAFLAGRDFVLPDDVQAIAPYVLRHRIIPATWDGQSFSYSMSIVEDIIGQTAVPV